MDASPTPIPGGSAMLTTATSEAMRLVSLFVRRLDSELVESAVRNAESSVLDQHRRRMEEMRTLRDLNAIQQRVAPSPARAVSAR
jgi:hypothetical protein